MMKMTTRMIALVVLTALWMDTGVSSPSHERLPLSTPSTPKHDVASSGQQARRLADSNDRAELPTLSRRNEVAFQRLKLLLSSHDTVGVQEFDILEETWFKDYLKQNSRRVRDLLEILQKGKRELIDASLSRFPALRMCAFDLTFFVGEARRTGNYELVEGLLRHGHGPKPNSDTACYLLFWLFNVEDSAGLSLLCRYLIDDASASSCWSDTQSLYSTSFSVDSLVVLHSKGVDLSQLKFSKGRSLLHLAAENNDRESVSFLLSVGLESSELDEKSVTPLQLALARSDLEIVYLLWEASVRPERLIDEQRIMEAVISESILDLQKMQRDSPQLFTRFFLRSPDWIAFAVRTLNTELVRILVETVPNKVVKLRLERDQTALHLAAQKGSSDLMQLLLGTQIPIDSFDSEGKSPLALAVKGGDLIMIKILLDHGADPNIVNSIGTKIVMLKAASQELPVLQLLIEYHGDLYDIEGEGDTLLFHVTKPEVAEFLISEGLSVNHVDATERCIFSCGSYVITHREALKVLIKHDIDPRYDEGLYHSLLGHVLIALDIELSMAVLAKHGAKEFANDPKLLTYGIDLEDLKALLSVLEYVEDINCKDDDNRPAWFEAVALSPFHIVEALLENGVNVTATDYYGATALHIAAYHGRNDVIDLLMKHGANVDALDQEGESPIMYAIQYSTKDCIWNLAITHHADLETGKHGNTPKASLEELHLLPELEADISRLRAKSATKI